MNLIYLFICLYGILNLFYAGYKFKNDEVTSIFLIISGYLLMIMGLNKI